MKRLLFSLAGNVLLAMVIGIPFAAAIAAMWTLFSGFRDILQVADLVYRFVAFVLVAYETCTFVTKARWVHATAQRLDVSMADILVAYDDIHLQKERSVSNWDKEWLLRELQRWETNGRIVAAMHRAEL